MAWELLLLAIMEHHVIRHEGLQDPVSHRRALRALAEYLLEPRAQPPAKIERRKLVKIEGFNVSLAELSKLAGGTYRAVLLVMGPSERRYAFDVAPGEPPRSPREALAQALECLADELRGQLGLGSPNVGQAEIPESQAYQERGHASTDRIRF